MRAQSANTSSLYYFTLHERRRMGGFATILLSRTIVESTNVRFFGPMSPTNSKSLHTKREQILSCSRYNNCGSSLAINSALDNWSLIGSTIDRKYIPLRSL